MSESVMDNQAGSLDRPTEILSGRSGVGQSTDSPGDVDAVREIITTCYAEKTSVFIQGGSTALFYGGNPARAGHVLKTRGMNRVLEYPVDDMTISVESGMTLAALQTQLAENNQYLPIDAPQATTATLGGIMATGWTGPRRHSAMRPRDQIIGIGFVDGTGRLVRGGGKVVKNVAGYDFPKLLTGSVGSLGVITDLTFKVRPRPESTALAWVSLPNIATVGGFLDRLNTSDTRPTAIELLNHGASRSYSGLATDRFSVVLFYDDSVKTVAWQCDRILSEIPGDSSCQILRDDQAVPVQQSLTEAYAGTGRTLIARAVTRPSALAQLVGMIPEDAWDIQAHAGQGIATLSLRPGIDPADVRGTLEELRQAVAPLGGSITLPLCPKELKHEFKVWGNTRPEWSIMAGLKRALDPAGILNPGILLDLA